MKFQIFAIVANIGLLATVPLCGQVPQSDTTAGSFLVLITVRH